MSAADLWLLCSLAGFAAVVYPLGLLVVCWLRAKHADDDGGAGWLVR